MVHMSQPAEAIEQNGVLELDQTGVEVVYRLLKAGDDLDALTELLHAAYRPLAEAGMRYVASYQDVAMTRRRIEGAETVVAISGGRLIGTVTWRKPGVKLGSAAHYNRPDVASFGQFAVAPSFQARGIGSRLLSIVEERSRASGAVELALDTSEDAAELIAFYRRRGYQFIDHVRWSEVNYRSVILSKQL